jgi:tRNA-dihydrouridine synthase C
LAWESLLPLLGVFWILVCCRLERKQQAGRLKQWLNFLRRRYAQAEVAYMELRTVNDPAVVGQWMVRQGVLAAHQIPVARRRSEPEIA